ncbi:hypothetical protein REPUB_Repub08aG0231000 [Reevesia pubescens]
MVHISLTIPLGVKQFWDDWNIRGAILFSLWLQAVLILVAPIRKSARKRLVIMLIWFAYLLADSAATFAVGLISNSQRNQSNNQTNIHEFNHSGRPFSYYTHELTKQTKPKENSDLLAFWAPFLLLHLGGPDTITAFALEDNELWLRHLLALGSQAAAVIYVCIQSLPNENLLIPTVLMFIAGIIKYVERTRALYLASLDKFRDSMLKPPDAGPNYAKLMEEYAFKREAKLPTRIDMTPEPDKEVKASDIPPKVGSLNHLEVVHYAYKYFQVFKGLVVDLIFSFRERDDSRDFFNKRSAEDALRIIEVELNFIYGTLYTKVEVVHSILGYIFRFLAFGSVLATLGIFYFHTKKDEFQGVDKGITYTLLLGAIALDLISFLMLIFSDRTFASIKDPDLPRGWTRPVAAVFSSFLALMNPWWYPCKCQIENSDGQTIAVEHHVLATPLAFRRWSGSISAHNLIRIIPLPDVVKEIMYVSGEPLTRELWVFIFDELKNKSEFADTPETAKTISSARGDWVLRDTDSQTDRSKLLKYVSDVQYDESLLLWHIATDLCYYTDDKKLKEAGHLRDEEIKKAEEDLSHRQFSKILSDYMLYLLVFQPTLMSAVAGIGKIRFRDTCAEAERFFRRRSVLQNQDNIALVCEEILSVNTDVEPVTVKGDRSKSVLFDASMLAKELEKHEDKWKILSRVWVELVSYAASHCRASTHAQEVSKGGELITFFWLLMAHFGLGEQYQINEGHARAKLFVGK